MFAQILTGSDNIELAGLWTFVPRYWLMAAEQDWLHRLCLLHKENQGELIKIERVELNSIQYTVMTIYTHYSQDKKSHQCTLSQR